MYLYHVHEYVLLQQLYFSNELLKLIFHLTWFLNIYKCIKWKHQTGFTS